MCRDLPTPTPLGSLPLAFGLPPPSCAMRNELEDLDAVLLNDLCGSDDIYIDELLRDVDSAVMLMAPPSAAHEAAVDSPRRSSPIVVHELVPPKQSLRYLANAAAQAATTPAQLFNAVSMCLDEELRSASPPCSPSSRCSASATPSISGDDLLAPAADMAAANPAGCLLAAADWRLPRIARRPVASPVPAAGSDGTCAGIWALDARAAAPLLRSSSLTSGAALPAWAAPHDARALKRSLSDPAGKGRRTSKQFKRDSSSSEGVAASLERHLHRELARKAEQRRLAQERLALLRQQPPAATVTATGVGCWQGAWQQ